MPEIKPRYLKLLVRVFVLLHSWMPNVGSSHIGNRQSECGVIPPLGESWDNLGSQTPLASCLYPSRRWARLGKSWTLGLVKDYSWVFSAPFVLGSNKIESEIKAGRRPETSLYPLDEHVLAMLLQILLLEILNHEYLKCASWYLISCYLLRVNTLPASTCTQACSHLALEFLTELVI